MYRKKASVEQKDDLKVYHEIENMVSWSNPQYQNYFNKMRLFFYKRIKIKT